MPLLHLTAGKENHRDKSAQIQAFLHVEGKECPVFVAPRKTDGPLHDKVTQIGTPQHRAARPGISTDIGGAWVTCNYEIADNTLIKLTVAKSLPNNRRNCMLFILMRDNAPLNRITIPLRLNRFSVIDEAVIEGRFDVLTLEQAKQRGASVIPAFERMFSDVMRNSMMRLEQREAAVAALPPVVTVTVQNDDGTERRVSRPGRRRTLDV